MLDGTLNITLENSPISTVFSSLTEQNFEQLTYSSFENFSSHLSDCEIFALAERIKAKPYSTDLLTLLGNFATWLGRLQNNQALVDDLTGDIQSESCFEWDDATIEIDVTRNIHPEDSILNYVSNRNNSLKVGYAMAGIDLEDSLLCYSDNP